MVESIKYEVVKRYGDLEVRRYPRMALVTVKDEEDDRAFGMLFSYIAGDNSGGAKIPMTAPVISSEYVVDALEETPQPGKPKRWFSFVLPAAIESDSAPRPSDGRIEIETLPERYVAALRFRGRSRPDEVRAMIQKLLFATRYARLTPKGGPFLMRYNSPFMPGLLRRNEIALEVSLPG